MEMCSIGDSILYAKLFVWDCTLSLITKKKLWYGVTNTCIPSEIRLKSMLLNREKRMRIQEYKSALFDRDSIHLIK